MKVRDLIKMLEKMPQSLDVVNYNGFVDDWQNIEIQKVELSRLTKNGLHKRIVLQDRQHGYEETKLSDVKFQDWKINYSEHEVHARFKNDYEYKNVVMVCPRNRGKDQDSWGGVLSY